MKTATQSQTINNEMRSKNQVLSLDRGKASLSSITEMHQFFAHILTLPRAGD